MERIRNLLKYTIQTIIVVYIAGVILLQLPVVQSFIGRKLANGISDEIGSKVEIGKVNLGFLNRMVVDNLTIYDQNNKKMLAATRVAANIELMPLIQDGKISISSAQLFGLKANLYKANASSKTNFQFALDSLASKDKTKKSELDLSIRSLVIRNGSVRYNQLDEPATVGRFSLKHLGLDKLSGHIVLKHATNNELTLEIRTLSFIEGSGFQLNKLRLNVEKVNNNIKVSKINIITPNSKIKNAFIKAYYQLKNGAIDKSSLRINSQIEKANIYGADFKAFIPALAKVKQIITLSEAADIKNNNINIHHLNISTSDQSVTIKATGKVNIAQKIPYVALKFSPLKTTTEALQNIEEIFNTKIPYQLKNLGRLSYIGNIETNKNKIYSKGMLQSDAGNARLNFALNKHHFSLDLNTPLLNVGKITGNTQLGFITTDLKASGTTDLNEIKINSSTPRFDFNKYSYRNIHIDGTYSNDAFLGTVGLNDPNGQLSFVGKVANIKKFISKKDKLFVDARVNTQGLNLAKLKLTEALGNKTIAFNSDITGSASSLEDINGVINLNTASIIGDGKILNINKLLVKSRSGILSKSLDIDSDLGTVHLGGIYSYETLASGFKNIVHHYLPSLSAQGFAYTPHHRKNDFVFHIKVTDFNVLKDYVNLPLTLKTPLSVSGTLNERVNALSLAIDSKNIAYAGTELKDLNILINTDSRKLTATINGEYVNSNQQRVIINSIADISNNNINSNINFFAPGRTPLKGRINSIINLSNREKGLVTKVHFEPSTISIDTINLQVQPSDLQYERRNLTINHFEISNKTQHITLNGTTSGNSEDSIMVHLKDIDVPYIMDLVNFHPVDFGGFASGTASVKSAFTNPSIKAHLQVKDFTFQNGAMGNLNTRVLFNNKEGVVYINGRTTATEDSYTDIKGYVDIKNNFINLPIYPHKTKIYFLESFCESFMDNIEGETTGWLKVIGPLNKINLEGDVTANGSMYIKPIGTRYQMLNAHVRMIPNQIIFEKDTIKDYQGNYGIVSGGLSHNNLKNLAYNINIDAHNLLSYNFPKQLNKESFWGIVYGTGSCNIIGKSGETTLNVSLTPNRNSHIVYDAALTSSIDESSFIRWKDSKSKRDSVLIPEVQTDSIPTELQTRNRLKDIVFRDFDIPSDLHMNFDFRVNPNLTLEVILDDATKDNITLNGFGGIRATYYNKGAFQMFGNFLVEQGLYNLTIQNIIKKQFTFQQGSTIAFGGDPFNAALNLKGVYTLNSVPLSDLQLGQSFAANNTKVNCLLDITGTPAAPSVTFGIDLPNLSSDAQQMVHSLLNSEQDLNQQALYLLAIGRFYPQGNNNSQQENTSQSSTSLAMQSLLSGTLSQQINTVLSNVIKTNNWNFGANIATGNEGFENAEYEGIFSGSLLNNRLLFNGEVGYRDNVTTNNSSFIGDFDLRYLIKRNGNIALHFYNKTNDRYFTRNSLTTQGIGIILKKDFDRLSDIFRSSSKKRKKATKKSK